MIRDPWDYVEAGVDAPEPDDEPTWLPGQGDLLDHLDDDAEDEDP